MSHVIELNESTAARRRVPCRVFTSNGTSPDTGATADAVVVAINSATTFSASSTLRAIESAQGMYWLELTQSEVSVLGNHALYHTVGDFPQHIANFSVVNYNPYSSFSNIAAKAYSGVTFEINNAAGDVSSRWTVAVSSIKAASYSGVSVGVLDIKPATYSGVTVGVNNITPNTYSGVTVGAGDIQPGAYSGVSVEVKSGGIQASSHGAGAVDAAALATDAVNEIADGLLGRNVGGGSSTGRTVKQALYAIRNRVVLSGLTGTVYDTDDTTSAFTFSITTVAAQAISEIDPGGV